MNELLDKRFLKALLLGGPLIILGLLLMGIPIGIWINKEFSWSLLIPFAIGIASLYAALWVTGFWGKWGMILFFVLSPVVLIADFSINPLAPAGSIVFGIICLTVFVSNNVLSRNS